jgi:hypothetical protein
MKRRMNVRCYSTPPPTTWAPRVWQRLFCCWRLADGQRRPRAHLLTAAGHLLAQLTVVAAVGAAKRGPQWASAAHRRCHQQRWWGRTRFWIDLNLKKNNKKQIIKLITYIQKYSIIVIQKCTNPSSYATLCHRCCCQQLRFWQPPSPGCHALFVGGEWRRRRRLCPTAAALLQRRPRPLWRPSCLIRSLVDQRSYKLL